MRYLNSTLIIAIVGLSMIPCGYVSGQDKNDKKEKISFKHQNSMSEWKQDMADFQARRNKDNKKSGTSDSIDLSEAVSAVTSSSFVLEADNITFPNGRSVFVNSGTNFISVNGDRAVVQISPSSFDPGPNGVGGITVDGRVSEMKAVKDRKGRITISLNVLGANISAQINIFITADSSQATATVSPNFNSNTIWLYGEIVPYDSSTVIEGQSF